LAIAIRRAGRIVPEPLEAACAQCVVPRRLQFQQLPPEAISSHFSQQEQIMHGIRPRSVTALISYLGAMTERPRYFANNHSRDVLVLDPRRVPIEDARTLATAPSLQREGFMLVGHRSAVSDFSDRDEVARKYPVEIQELVQRLSGADAVVVSSPGILRFSEASQEAGRHHNSWPARFIHIDVSDTTAQAFAERTVPQNVRPLLRYAHYNVWRVITPPPQDVPLAVCDARTLAPADLVAADAVFDAPDRPEWSFEGLLVHHSDRHRWSYFSGMTPDEALVFKTHDSDPRAPHHVPHTAFDDPGCPPGAVPRASIEMRAIAFWFGA
jgi:hypothetical protein